jgi:hypothetical protein
MQIKKKLQGDSKLVLVFPWFIFKSEKNKIKLFTEYEGVTQNGLLIK